MTRVNARQHAPMTDYPRQGIGTQIAGAIGASNLGTTRMRDRWQVPMRFRKCPIWGGWGMGGGETKQQKQGRQSFSSIGRGRRGVSAAHWRQEEAYQGTAGEIQHEDQAESLEQEVCNKWKWEIYCMAPFEALQGVFQEMAAQLGPPVSDVLWFWIGVFFSEEGHLEQIIVAYVATSIMCNGLWPRWDVWQLCFGIWMGVQL